MIASATPPPAHSDAVPATRLVASPRNVRTLHKARGIEELAESILQNGLLQNLVVSFDGTDYPVEGGERRRQAIQLLIDRDALPADWSVPVRIIAVDGSRAASLAENLLREAMHPADQFAAFHDLTREGWSIEKIAAAFGVTRLVVERRLALAKAAPALLEALGRDEITTEQLSALCATDDHALQEAVWNGQPTWNRDPRFLRRAVLSTEVDVVQDPRIRFIGGPDAFLAAGGVIRRDLFSADGEGGLIGDIALLEQLVAQELDTAAAAVRAEGWGWIEIWPEWSYTDFFRLGQLARDVSLSPDDAARVQALEEEHRLAADEITRFEEGEDAGEEADSERLEDLYARMEAIDAEIASIKAEAGSYDPEAIAVAGAVVGREGHMLRIERGLVRPADRAKVAQAVSGGSTSVPEARGVGELSDALTRSLLGHRNLAVQTATARAPEVAKVLLACWIVQTIRQRWHKVPLDLRITDASGGTRTQHPIADESGESLRNDFDGIGTDLIALLPADERGLWDALAALPGAELDRLIAFVVGAAVSLTREHAGLTACLLEALQFDMADRFAATAGNYFGRVPKAAIVEALADAGGVTDEAQKSHLLTMKKGALAAHAESLLAGKRWVPALIRTPQPPPIPAEKKAPRKPSAKPSGRRRVMRLPRPLLPPSS